MSEYLGYAALAVSILALAAYFYTFAYIRNRLATGGAGREAAHGAGRDERLERLERELRALDGRRQEDADRLAATLRDIHADLTERAEELAAYAGGALRHTYVHSYSVGNGGPESAVLVLADAGGNGLLLNVLAGKTVRVYTRLVTGWQAAHLSQEEEQALEEARQEAGP